MLCKLICPSETECQGKCNNLNDITFHLGIWSDVGLGYVCHWSMFLIHSQLTHSYTVSLSILVFMNIIFIRPTYFYTIHIGLQYVGHLEFGLCTSIPQTDIFSGIRSEINVFKELYEYTRLSALLEHFQYGDGLSERNSGAWISFLRSCI